MPYIEEDLTEQQRVRLIAGLWAIGRIVHRDKRMDVIEEAADFDCDSSDIAKILDLPQPVVNAALENLSDDGEIMITAREEDA